MMLGMNDEDWLLEKKKYFHAKNVLKNRVGESHQ
jgi:hypothetical protein